MSGSVDQNPAISFGDYITAYDVITAVRTTIQTWSATYLAEMARHDQQNPSIQFEALPDFNSFPSALDMGEFVEEQLPSCIITVPNILSPRRQGDGLFTVDVDVSIGVAVSGQNTEDTRKLAGLYGAAVRLLILQKSSLGNFTTSVEWLKEDYSGNFIREADQRTLSIGELDFRFTIDDFANDSDGPLTPLANANPPIGWPVVEYPSMTVTVEPVGQEP